MCFKKKYFVLPISHPLKAYKWGLVPTFSYGSEKRFMERFSRVKTLKFAFSPFNSPKKNSKKGKRTAAWLICLYKKKYLFQNIPAIVIGKRNRKIPSFQKNLFPLCLIKLKVQGRLEEKSEPIPTSLFFQCQRLFHQTF